MYNWIVTQKIDANRGHDSHGTNTTPSVPPLPSNSIETFLLKFPKMLYKWNHVMGNVIDTHLLFLEVFWRLLAYFTLTIILYVQGLPSNVWILVTVFWDIRIQLCGTKVRRLLSFLFPFLSSCFLSYVTIHKSCPDEMSHHRMVLTPPCKILTVLKLKALCQIL